MLAPWTLLSGTIYCAATCCAVVCFGMAWCNITWCSGNGCVGGYFSVSWCAMLQTAKKLIGPWNGKWDNVINVLMWIWDLMKGNTIESVQLHSCRITLTYKYEKRYGENTRILYTCMQAMETVWMMWNNLTPGNYYTDPDWEFWIILWLYSLYILEPCVGQ